MAERKEFQNLYIQEPLVALDRQRKLYKAAEDYTQPIFRAAYRALRNEYPELNRLTQAKTGSIRITSPSDIHNARIDSIKTSTSFISEAVLGILVSFKIPITEIIKWRNQAFPESGYSDYLTPEFYLPQNILDDLVEGSHGRRTKAAVRAARTLVEESIKSFAYRISPKEFEHNPWDFFFCYMAREEAKDYFDSLKGHVDKKQRGRLREARDKVLDTFTMDGINSLGGVFIARGGAVDYLLPGQKPTPERVIGASFDNALVRILAAPVMRKFANLVNEYSEGRIQIGLEDIDKEYESGKNYEQDHKADENAQRILQALGLRGKNLFSAYINSELPLRYMRTNNASINPFRYAQFVQPN